MPLTANEVTRYSRHLLLPEVGKQGQARLKESRALIVGAGGLGSPVLLYLAAAGVGTLGIVDDDSVDVTNLQRQVLYGTTDLGRAKTEAAAAHLEDLNPFVRIERHTERLSASNALALFSAYDIVIDGTDNFATRYLVNDACVLTGKPNVYGSIFRFDGQASVFCTDEGPCYRCLYPEPPPPGLVPSCAEGGVLGVLPGLIGVVQATEAIKLLLGLGDTLVGRLLLVNALAASFRTVRVRRNPQCAACGTREIRELRDYDAWCGTHLPADIVPEITPRELAARAARGEGIQLLDVREPHEWELVHVDGARLIPLAQLDAQWHTLDATRELFVYCKGGVRSAQAVSALRKRGFDRAYSVTGGIVRWREEVDDSLLAY
ncbi:MAG TPA: molybdopterin-synthase adenylyltransferase MoeB [Gemmatimonadaceae bacterium]|nr:molybdopterin-synthase adenylyltransferase MoeB [Gemmatimonadaceae bacterium]